MPATGSTDLFEHLRHLSFPNRGKQKGSLFPGVLYSPDPRLRKITSARCSRKHTECAVISSTYMTGIVLCKRIPLMIVKTLPYGGQGRWKHWFVRRIPESCSTQAFNSTSTAMRLLLLSGRSQKTKYVGHSAKLVTLR